MTEPQLNPAVINKLLVDSVFRKMPGLIVLDVVAACLLLSFAMFVAQNYQAQAYTWFGFAIGMSVLRGFFTIHLQQFSDSYRYVKRIQLFVVVSCFISGMIWGTSWLIHPGLVEFEAPRGALLTLPFLYIASAIVFLAPVRPAYFALALTTACLQIVHLLYIGEARNLQYAGGYALLTFVASLLALNIYRDKLQAIKSEMLVRQLREDLLEDEEKLKAKESELLERIAREQELIEEKQRSDHKLEEATQEKLLLLDAIDEGVLGISRTGKVNFINPAALNLLDFTEAEVLNRDAVTVLCPSTTLTGKEAETRKALIKSIEDGTPLQGMQGVFAGASNALLPVSFSCRPVKKENAHFGIVLSFADQSKQKDIEAKLVASQKMEAMGRITGGVAHDFNNLLTVIIGNLQFLKRRYFKDDPGNGAALVDKVMSAAKSGAELNSRLLSYSREQSLQNEVTDIKKLLQEMGNFLTRILGEEISIQFEFGEDPAVVSVDRHQFENVAMNLCLNARDAMPEGGVVTIGTRSIRLEESPVVATNNNGEPNNGKENGDYVEITFADTGTGVPLDIQQKIFDPFFTTKERGKGTGFGLSTAFGFLQQSGGSIRVESIPGEGATFVLVLPRVAEELLLQKNSDKSEAEPGGYNGTVLVVEDDDDVRDIASHTLLDAGYHVLLAENGNKGLELFQKHRNIDLVFSDIIMPGGMTGVEMAQEIQRIKPIPVLLATGYAEKMLKDKIQDSANIICIAKPYDTDELPALIDSMLNKKAS